MNDLKNNNDLKPEQSWLKAEKMLDGHFRKRRTIMWSLVLFITGVLVVSTTVIINHFSQSGSSQNKNTDAKQFSGIPTGQLSNYTSDTLNRVENSNKFSDHKLKTVSVEKAGENNHLDKRQPRTVAYVERTGKAEEIKLSNKKILFEKKYRHQKKNRNDVHSEGTQDALASDSENLIKQEETNNPQISGEVTRPESSGAIKDFSSPVTHAEHVADQPAMQHEPDMSLVNPISLSQFSIASVDPYVLSDSLRQEKNISLPGKKPDFKILIYGSAQYVFKNLESKKFSDYIVRRKNEEQGIITGSLGASLQCEIRKFSISVGIEYSSWGEKNGYAPFLMQKNLLENGSYQPFYRVNFDTAYISGNQWIFAHDSIPDSSFISRIDTITQNSYSSKVSSANGINKFYFIEVPVGISYRFTHSRFGFGATVGISPAWLIGEKGYYLNRDLSGVESISQIKATNKFMMNGRFSMDFYYCMNERINLLVRPEIKMNFNSIFQSGYDVNQKYYSTGLAFGLSYSIK